jgi:hypothetical protein
MKRGRAVVRMFFGLLIIITIGWSAYWWVGSTAQQTGLTAWLDDRRAAGWVADYDDLSVKGYPSRFDTSITNLNLADPKSGWAWNTPFLQVLMLSYQPNHVIAVLPPEHVVSTPTERINVKSDVIRASIKFDANTDLALNAVSGEMENVILASNAGRTSEMKAAKLATRQTTGVANSHDLFFQADGVKPARIFTKLIDPDSQLPDVFDTLRIDVTAGFDAPWDRHAVEGKKPEFTALTVKDVSATWGEMNFQAKGDLTFDADGYPTGKLSVRAKNWKDMITLGVSAGAIPQDLQSTLEGGLGLLARLSGNPDTIDAPLSFKNGFISLGPIPIGRAPQLRLNP